MKSFDSFQQFAAYLMVHLAHSDGQMHFLEEATLISNLRAFDSDAETLLEKMLTLHKAFAGEKLSDILQVNEGLLQSATAEEKQNLLRLLFSIVNSDGKVQGEETEQLKIIRTALQL